MMGIAPNSELRILVVPDLRLSRERSHLFMRQINGLKRLAQVDLLKTAPTEEATLEALRAEGSRVDLLLLPWDFYLSWSRVEAHFGITRLKGPTSAGYIAEPLSNFELEHAASSFSRSAILDLVNLKPTEAQQLVGCMLNEKLRTGIRPWLESSAPSYCETWYSSQGLGFRIDQCLRIPGAIDWSETRGMEIRTAITALWGLIYEEGPGKSEFRNIVHARVPKAWFQVGCDEKTYVLRLCYRQRGRSPADLVRIFRPDSSQPYHPAQILLRYADFVKVQIVPETGDTEVMAIFWPSASSHSNPEEAGSQWIAPISASLLTEKFYEEPSERNPLLRPMPDPMSVLLEPTTHRKQEQEKLDKRIFDAAVQIRELRRKLQEKEERIQELKSGGVGAQNIAPPPVLQAEELVEVLRSRLHTLRWKIEQLEDEVMRLETAEPSSSLLPALNQKLVDLRNREHQVTQSLESLTGRGRNDRSAA